MKTDRSKLKMIINQIIGMVVFMIGIFATYQGALNQKPWLGPLIVMLIIIYDLLSHRKNIIARLKFLFLVAFIGMLTESLLIIFSVYSVEPNTRWLINAPFAPLWILALWLNFGTRLPSYLSFLNGKHILNAISGFVFAILIFHSAKSMGIITFQQGTLSLLICAIAWAIIIPIIYIIAAKLLLKPSTKEIK